MENASKALLIAGEMLIAILVVSLMVLLFSTMSSYVNEYKEKQKNQEIQAFNANITQYTKEESTAQDIVSLVNFAKQIQKQDIIITVICLGENMLEKDEDELMMFLQNNSVGSNGLKKYIALVEYSNEGRINKVTYNE